MFFVPLFVLTGQAAPRSYVIKVYCSDSDVKVIVVYFSVRKLELDYVIMLQYREGFFTLVICYV